MDCSILWLFYLVIFLFIYVFIWLGIDKTKILTKENNELKGN